MEKISGCCEKKGQDHCHMMMERKWAWDAGIERVPWMLGWKKTFLGWQNHTVLGWKELLYVDMEMEMGC